MGEVTAPGWSAGSLDAVRSTFAGAGLAGAAGAAIWAGAGAGAGIGIAWKVCLETFTFSVSLSPYSRLTAISVNSFSFRSSARALMKATSAVIRSVLIAVLD